MKTLLIIGGSGFLGGSFFDFFNKNNKSKFNIKKIIFLSRKGKKLGNKINKKIQFEYKKSDILNLKKLPICDYIIYAANSANNKKDIQALKKFNSLLDKRFLKTKIIFTSSGAVYGYSKNSKKFKENDKIILKNVLRFSGYKKNYALTKIQMENIIKSIGNDGYRVSICRLFTFFGNRIISYKKYAISDLIYSANKYNLVKINNTNTFRSYMSSDDMVKWILKILFSAKTSCPIYNVGSDLPLSMKKLSEMILKIKKVKVTFKNLNKNKDYYIPSITKAKKLLKLKIKENLFQFLKKEIL